MSPLSALELCERPREKLSTTGPAALSDTELVAILLGSGSKSKDVLALAKEVVQIADDYGEHLSSNELELIQGIGPAKATLILAALEFSRRRIRPHGIKIKSAADVYPLVRHLGDRKQEVVITISLNGAHEVINTRIITIGLLNRSQIHPREVFSDVIIDRAAAVILAHNHPSGDLTPSTEDIEVTKRLKAAGELLGVPLLDHLIFSHAGFASMLELGLIA